MRLALIGTGNMATRMLTCLRNINQDRPVAVVSHSASRAQAFAQEMGIAQSFDSVAEMLATVKPDGVYIASAAKDHFEAAKTALEAGVHVWCEKPVTLSARETDQLVDIARKTSCVLFENYWVVYQPAFVDLVRSVKAGDLGALKHFQMQFTGYLPPQTPEGQSDDLDFLVYDRVGYLLTAAIAVMGDISEIVVTTPPWPSSARHLKIFARHSAGGVSDLCASMDASWPNAIHVSGDKASATLPLKGLGAERISYSAHAAGPAQADKGAGGGLRKYPAVRTLKSVVDDVKSRRSFGADEYGHAFMAFKELVQKNDASCIEEQFINMRAVSHHLDHIIASCRDDQSH